MRVLHLVDTYRTAALSNECPACGDFTVRCRKQTRDVAMRAIELEVGGAIANHQRHMVSAPDPGIYDRRTGRRISTAGKCKKQNERK